jgi:surfactin synthase thioesterase subunit
MLARSTPYLDRRPDPADPLRLFCFHHAGGGAASFTGWREALGPAVAVFPVQLPGRERRAGEARITDMARLVDELDRQVGPWLDRPYAFYGHSLGALVGYALAQRRLARGNPAPVRLIAGAYPGPALAAPLSAVPELDDETLATLLVDIGGMSEVVRRYPEWTAAAIALLRDDLRICHSYRAPGTDRPLPCPIDVCTGLSDPLVSRADADAWAAHTTDRCAVHVLPGGHLFLTESRERLLRIVRGLLSGSAVLAAPLAEPTDATGASAGG